MSCLRQSFWQRQPVQTFEVLLAKGRNEIVD